MKKRSFANWKSPSKAPDWYLNGLKELSKSKKLIFLPKDVKNEIQKEN
jgi:hypothetical protein